MRKFKFFIDYDKEEKWLNSMAKRGYELKKVSFGYKFSSSTPQECNIKIDCREFKNKKDFVDYCTLFEDSGWKHICGNKYSGTQYFKKVDANGYDDIFSDRMSKSERYKRLSNMWMKTAITCLCIILALGAVGVVNLKAFINPKLLYLTPGLWNLDGTRFWDAFWFETPFAIYRGILLLIPIVFIILYFIFSYRADKLYKRENSNDFVNDLHK